MAQPNLFYWKHNYGDPLFRDILYPTFPSEVLHTQIRGFIGLQRGIIATMLAEKRGRCEPFRVKAR